MTQDDWIGLIILLGIIALGLFGGFKGAAVNGLFSVTQTPEQKAQSTQAEIAAEAAAKVASPYKGMITLENVNRNDNTSDEYVTIHMSSSAAGNVDVTGWTLKSIASGQSVQIPQGVYLYFTNTLNSREDIVMAPGDTMYLVSGESPIGESFKSNECTGYLEQFQTFVPYINRICPLLKNEDLSSIPRYTINDPCFDYIDSYPACQTQTDPLPTTWSPECTNFILNTENYPECITLHKNDPNFYQPEWHAYLDHTISLWQPEREDVVLYDNNGKVVSEITY